MKSVQPLLGKVVFIVLAMTFAVVCHAQRYPAVPPTAPPPNATGSTYVEPREAKTSKEGDLSGKVLCIIPKHYAGRTYEIENPQCRAIGGRTFLVGKAVDANYKKLAKPPFVGSTVWVSVEEIESIHVFKNVHHLRKALPQLIGPAGEEVPPPSRPPYIGVNETEAPELPPQESPWSDRRNSPSGSGTGQTAGAERSILSDTIDKSPAGPGRWILSGTIGKAAATRDKTAPMIAGCHAFAATLQNL